MRWVVKLTKPVLMLVAFALSMVLYLHVQIPNKSTTVSLLVKGENLNEKLKFEGEGSPVDFSVAGPQDQIDLLKSRLAADSQYVMATVDLRGIKPGDVEKNPYVELTPVVTQVADLTGLKFVPVRRLESKIEEPATRLDVPIRIELMPTPGGGIPSERDTVASDFEAEPRTVNLTGPASQLRTVQPTVTVSPDDVERSGIVEVPLQLKDNTYAGSLPVETNPHIQSVEVRATHHQRPVMVNIHFHGRVASGYAVTNQYVVSDAGPTSTAFIRGPGDRVEKVGAVDATVDISGLKAGFMFRVNPVLPDRIELVDAPLRIQVDVAKIRP